MPEFSEDQGTCECEELLWVEEILVKNVGVDCFGWSNDFFWASEKKRDGKSAERSGNDTGYCVWKLRMLSIWEWKIPKSVRISFPRFRLKKLTANDDKAKEIVRVQQNRANIFGCFTDYFQTNHPVHLASSRRGYRKEWNCEFLKTADTGKNVVIRWDRNSKRSITEQKPYLIFNTESIAMEIPWIYTRNNVTSASCIVW
jgi:hypothetical protein